MPDKRRQTKSTLAQLTFAAALGALFLMSNACALGQVGSAASDEARASNVLDDADDAYIQADWKLFLVGTNSYEHLDSEYDLQFSVKDVEAIRDRFLELGVPEENITILTSQSRGALRSTKRNIEIAFRRYIARLNKGDNAFIYLSGHDIRFPRDLDVYYLPQDADLTSKSTVVESSVSIEKMVEALQNSGVNLKWMTVDACHLDAMAVVRRDLYGPDRGSARDFISKSVAPDRDFAAPARGIQLVNDESAPDIAGLSDTLILMQGAEDDQVTIESPELEQGLMAYALLEALQFEDNPADSQQAGELKLSDVLGYVQTRTEELSQMYRDDVHRSAEQSPTCPIFVLEDATFLTNLRHGGLTKFQIQLIKAEEEKFVSYLNQNDYDRAQTSLATLAEYYPEGKKCEQYQKLKQKLADALSGKTDEMPGDVNVEALVVHKEADDRYKEALKAFYLKEYESATTYVDEAITLYSAPEYSDFRTGLLASTVRAEVVQAIADRDVETAKSMNQVFAKLDAASAKANDAIIVKLESASDAESSRLPGGRTRRAQNANYR